MYFYKIGSWGFYYYASLLKALHGGVRKSKMSIVIFYENQACFLSIFKKCFFFVWNITNLYTCTYCPLQKRLYSWLIFNDIEPINRLSPYVSITNAVQSKLHEKNVYIYIYIIVPLIL